MAKRANPTLIGAFVLGGLTLVVAAVLVLGGREWFKRPVTCAMAFDGNVAGLTVGSPVSFRGVQLGTVSSIQLRAGTPFVIVLAQLDPSRVSGLPGLIVEKGLERAVEDAVKRGMRARLEVQSLVTGQLYVGLEDHPDTPVRITGIDKARCEIPTIPSTLAQFQDQLKKVLTTVEQLPLKELVESATRTVDGIDQVVRSPELRHAVESLDGTMTEARAVLRNLDARVDTSATALQVALGEAQRTIDEVGRAARKLVENVDSQVQPLAARLDSRIDTSGAALQVTLEQARRTIDEVGRATRKLVENVDSQVQPLATNLGSTSDSARALVRDAQRSLHAIDERLGPALSSLQAAGDAARDALRKAERSLDQVDGALDGRSPLGYQLIDALDELSRALHVWRALGEEIERQPNVLLLGRGRSRE